MNRGAFVLSVGAAAAAPSIGSAQTVTVEDAIARLFTAPVLQAAWFGPIFLAAIPPEKTRAIIDDIVGALGAYRSIAPNGARYTLTFARGTIQGEGALDDSGAFTGLLFSRMQSPATADRLVALFDTKPTPAAWFSDRMLNAVPIEKIGLVLSAMQAQYGSFQKAAPAKDGSYDVAFANGSATALIFLGSDGKIEGLIFQPH